MNIAFVSNILNHHQTGLCEALKEKCDRFYFIATEEVETLGYQRLKNADYVVHYYDENEKELAEKIINEVDVLIFGSCDSRMIEKRIEANKLTFWYAERLFKKGTWRRFIPSTRKKIHDRILKFKDKNLFVLCASAYLSYDLSLLNFPTNKCYKWGYFPEVDLELKRDTKTKCVEILWAGRMIDWKKPEAIIYLAYRLKNDDIEFHISVAGDGPKLNMIKAMAEKKGLTEHIDFYGSVLPEEVRSMMAKADIYIATSDYQEGWGAVVNEAMSSGCAVVASNAMGSVPFLIDKNSGKTFKSGDWKTLYKEVKNLIENPKEMEAVKSSARARIQNIWNASNASEQLLKLIESFDGKSFEYENKEGPCSKI